MKCYPCPPVFTDLGLLSMRIMLGVIFLFHGSQKLIGAFDGPGLSGFADVLGTKMGLPFPMLNAILAASAEFFGGLFVLVGALTRLATIPMIVTMLVAAFMVHGQAFSSQKQGMEYPLSLAVFLFALLLMGPGRFSVDRCLFKSCETKHSEPPPASVADGI